MGNFSVSAATVTINDQGLILLIQRADSGEWQIPGGVVEAGEQPTEAAVRETFEETGINVELVNLSGVYTNSARNISAFVFRAKKLSGDATLSEESVSVSWKTPEEAKKLLSPVFIPRISDALAQDPVVKFRKHDGIKFIA